MRVSYVDEVRGHLFFMMMITHTVAVTKWEELQVLHWQQKILVVSAAEFFVLLSGGMLGWLSCYKQWSSHQLGARACQLVTRRIYPWYLLAAVPFILASIEDGKLLTAVGEVIVLHDGGLYSDVLVIYVWCFALAALALVVPVGVMVAASAALYGASLTSNTPGFFGYGSFVPFNLAAWQFLFCIGVLLGRLAPAAAAAVRRWPVWGYVSTLLGVGVVFVVLRELIPYEWYGTSPKFQLHPLQLVKVLVCATGTWLLLARPVRGLWLLQALPRWYFSRPVLRRLGMPSIEMFTAHVWLLFACSLLPLEPGTSTQRLVAVLCLAVYVFVIPPLVLWWRSRQGRVTSPVAAE